MQWPNVRPTVRSATTEEARDISLASAGNHPSSAETATSGPTTGWEDHSQESRGNSHSRDHKGHLRSRSTSHNIGRCPTPENYSQDSVTLYIDSLEVTNIPEEGTLLTDWAQDKQHFSWPPSRQPSGTKKNEFESRGRCPNTIPLHNFKTLFPNLLDYLGNPKRGTLKHANKTGINHEGSPQPFMGDFFLDIKHRTEPVFYITTSPPMLLSYAACDQLGILEIKVPNEESPAKMDSQKENQKICLIYTLMRKLYSHQSIHPLNRKQHLSSQSQW